MFKTDEDIFDDPQYRIIPFRGTLMPKWFRVVIGILLIFEFLVVLAFIYAIFNIPRDDRQISLLIIFPLLLLLVAGSFIGALGMIAELKWAADCSFWVNVVLVAYILFAETRQLYEHLAGLNPPGIDNTDIAVGTIIIFKVMYLAWLARIRPLWKKYLQGPNLFNRQVKR